MTGDDPERSARAGAVLDEADEIVLTVTAPCELDRVLRKHLKHSRADTLRFLRAPIDGERVRCLRWTVEEGLEALEATFDRKAAEAVRARGAMPAALRRHWRRHDR